MDAVQVELRDDGPNTWLTVTCGCGSRWEVPRLDTMTNRRTNTYWDETVGRAVREAVAHCEQKRPDSGPELAENADTDVEA